MVLAICTSSNGGQYFHDVPWGYLERSSSYRATERAALYSVLGIAKVLGASLKNIYPIVMVVAICTSSYVG